MGIFSLVQTIWAAGLPCFSQVAQLALTGSGDGLRLMLHDPVSGRVDSFALGGSGDIRARDITTHSLGPQRTLTFEGTQRSLDQASLTRLADQAADSFGASATSWLDGGGFYGNLVRLEMMDLGNQQLLAVARPGGAGFSTYSYTASGTLTPLQTFADTSRTDLATVSAMTAARIGGESWFITASMTENSLTLFRIQSNGRLSLTSTFGFDDQLPVHQPALLASVDQGDTALILMASYGTSSLTVMALHRDGSLHFVDQVNDSRETRFAGVAAMDVVRVAGHDLVALAGNDGGISLYQILPNGRLLHRETLVDTLGMALDGVSSLHFSQTAAGLELWVIGTRDQGLTRLALDAEELGLRLPGQDGGAGVDVVIATPAGGTLRANAGDDVLVDGAGADVFWGGAGADVFVMSPDDVTDTIRDFDPREDRLDLSAYPMLHGAADVSLRAASGGAIVRIGTEDLRLYTANGAALTLAQLTPALIFGTGHVFMPEALPQTGTSGNDIFEALGLHADTLDGGSGMDTVSYVQAAGAVVVNLGDDAQNSGAATGYILRNIESVTGTAFNDRLTGDDGVNVLNGLAGNDSLSGMGGNDWIAPGQGRDTVDGGAGIDMISFSDQAQAVVVNLTTGTAQVGRDTKQITGIENVTGTIYSDFLTGDANDNWLRGLGGYDWFIATTGNDTYDGSNGRDMVTYINAPSAVTVDLGQQRGLAGMAATHIYVGIERVTGSVHNDVFYGSAGQDEFRAAGGYDWFIDSPGRDRYDGGTGFDTVAYSLATSGVSASLLRGSGGPHYDLYISIENLTGSSFADNLIGDHGRNTLRGQYGNDTLMGNGGNDRLEGGGSNDYLDGGLGWDVAVYSGNRRDYSITMQGDTTTISHLNNGRDGTDILHSIEAFSFADGLFYA